MDIFEVLDQVRERLQQQGRMSYRLLQAQFQLDAAQLELLKEELIDIQEVATDKDGKMLVWTGDKTSEETPAQTADTSARELPVSALSVSPEQQALTGERRQLTVMFCDLVGSTALSEQLDPEELQTVVRTYQEVSAQVIERYAGYIAQYLGDGLLVYFGYPAAHEDDAARAIRAGLEIVSALDQARSQFPQPIHVRIGIHTGPVVVGQMGGGSRHEQLALGETPNIAARVQDKAQPDQVVISAVAQRLVVGLFEIEDQGRHELKGIATPQPLYRVTAESSAQSRFEVAVRAGLTPLVGREHELSALRERWLQAQGGHGQAVLLSGEPGIGKSRLVQELKSQVAQEGATPIEFRCSPYHQNSALYPVTEHFQRLLQFTANETPETKLAKLDQRLGRYRFPQPNTLPLLAALLSLPHPEGLPPLTVSPQKQKELTQAALVAWLLEETEQQPVYNAWEDLHWADPSTLEVLDLLLTQVPTTRLLAVLTFRPEFIPPWGTHSYLSQLTLTRLGQPQVNSMIERVTGSKPLPDEIVQQIVTKTDGVPLFVEELTKMVMESDMVRVVDSHYELTGPLVALTIPSTLQDSLMARLDRLQRAKVVAQLGATIGRAFSYDLLHAVSPVDEADLQQGLQELVDAELVYQRGLPPRARYLFKHALIQETAYESLLKSTRQQYHQRIAQVLEGQFPDTRETQPDLLAHHYTEAGFIEEAIPYWQQAAEGALARSANIEAERYLSTGITLLNDLADTPERAQQELLLQMTRSVALEAITGHSGPEVQQAYTRARELCQEVGETPQLIPILLGLSRFYHVRAEYQTAREFEEQALSLAHKENDIDMLLQAHYALGDTLMWCGELALARSHLEQSLTLYDREQHRAHALQYGFDPGLACWGDIAVVSWALGYPDQALTVLMTALPQARELAHPMSLVWFLNYIAALHVHRREAQSAREWVEEVLALSTEHDFPHWVAWGEVYQGWALAELGQVEEGIVQIQRGIATFQATGAEIARPHCLALLASAYGKIGRAEDGLPLVAEGLTLIGTSGERLFEAELYRLKGTLMLQASSQHPQAPVVQESEECFCKALSVARHQQAKSLELGVTISLARLWQSQGKTTEARQLLSEVYDWFTEGFDTPDLKDAKALLDSLA